MKEENKNGQLPEKEQLLSSLRNAEDHILGHFSPMRLSL